MRELDEGMGQGNELVAAEKIAGLFLSKKFFLTLYRK